ncbi:MAG: outer membrane beta-barrel protein [Gammaproteobacteria bacterium]
MFHGKNNNRRNCLVVCVFVALLLNTGAVYAETANQYFDIGVQAAQRQQYQSALKALLQARDAGLDSPELNYNLGVVYYQLKRYDQAGANFQLLVEHPKYTAVAFYNLGLISLKQGNEPAAKDYFSQAHTLAVDENLKALSLNALQHFDAPEAKQTSSGGWGGLVSLNGGYDDNVSLIDEDISQARGIDDYHMELFASTDRMILGSVSNGIHFDANVDVLKQQNEHDYDYSQWHLALAHRGVFSRWNTRARVNIDRSRYGNVDFQQLLGLDLRGQHDLSSNTAIELRYKYVDIKDRSPNEIYDYLAGNRQQLRVRLTNARKNISFKYSYELQLNDRNDFTDSIVGVDTTVVGFSSYSPLRHNVQISADVPWGRSLTLSLEAQYRYSDYREADTILNVDNTSGASTVLYSLNRKDSRYRMNIGLAYHLMPYMELFADYGFTRNDSNREGSDYDRTLVRAGVTWFY